jgi:hypothetical protein
MGTAKRGAQSYLEKEKYISYQWDKCISITRYSIGIENIHIEGITMPKL